MPETPNPAGRLDVLATRLVERTVRQFEQETVLSGLWEAIQPQVEEWTGRHLAPAPKKAGRRPARKTAK